MVEDGMDRVEAERSVYGTTHGAIGAYLLGLWGLPRNMVEAVAFYDKPGTYSYHAFRPLTALHVAHVLCENKTATLEEIYGKFDVIYLDQIGTREKIEEWFELYHDLIDIPEPELVGV